MNIFGQMNMILHHQIYQHKSSKVNVNITGAIVGSLIVCALFVFALYLWNKRNQAEKNIFNHGQGIVESPDNGKIQNYELES
ncbi:hypothetical protein RhiirA4_546507 [Rhizophagus irregularis]|uniref:Uncharacterized protein n=1 Tax=Rhizophagus irregularis TaxID=588596 RepID=A0A2I1GXI0_9GLOM|nr:hypothetical protein RhiirA4_546507 [Rhizophagus irregularis]